MNFDQLRRNISSGFSAKLGCAKYRAKNLVGDSIDIVIDALLVAFGKMSEVAKEITVIAPLTSLRFIAAAAVLVHHMQATGAMPKISGPFFLFDGVSFFFVLSGFVLHHVYREDADHMPWRDFYRLRVARVWPLHGVVYIGALVLLVGVPAASNFAETALGFLLLQAWIPYSGAYFAVNGVSWTLSCEMFFYALFPALSVMSKGHPAKTAAWTVAGLVLYLGVGSTTFRAGQNVDIATGLFAISPLVRLPEFILGLLLYEAFLRLRKTDLGVRAWTALEIGSFALIALTNLLSVYILPKFAAVSFPAAIWLMNAGTAPAFGLCVLIFALSRGGLVGRFLSKSPFVYLGEISFAVYLIHQPVIRYLANNPFTDSFIPRWLAIIVITLGLSALSRHFLEVPVMKWARGARQNKAAPVTLAAAASS